MEVKHQGKWGTVYVQYWFLEDANTLCRHLECGVATDAPRGSYFGPRLGTIWYFYLSCNRTEPESTLSINNCVQPDFKNYTHILSHDQYIKVVKIALKKDIVLKVQDSFFESGLEKGEVFCRVK